MTDRFRRWETPRLRVLLRSGGQEKVLLACKFAGIQGQEPNNVYALCWTVVPCEHCQSWGAS